LELCRFRVAEFTIVPCLLPGASGQGRDGRRCHRVRLGAKLSLLVLLLPILAVCPFSITACIINNRTDRALT
jgi:hypothetical protein